jgi:hypothetical protein
MERKKVSWPTHYFLLHNYRGEKHSEFISTHACPFDIDVKIFQTLFLHLFILKIQKTHCVVDYP